MKKITLIFLSCLTLFTALPALAEKVEAPEECSSCGMNRTTFAQSRMVVTFSDNSSTGTCSVNCAVQIMQEQRGKMIKSIQVGDYDSKKLIDARKAFWVTGGSKRGVMSPTAKWAFAEKKGAEAFIRQHGGKQVTFDEVLKGTEKELEEADQPTKHDHKGHGDHGM
ncbi:MAG TPA: nitrous oxide reductase accessory protein NosL [Geobacteraceae bacterium]|nr:nitrous oxide reductase accessory protein NosL [Geobacteraceae bacterium]